MRWAGYVACVGENRGAYSVWWGNVKERDHVEQVSVYGRIILKWIIKIVWEGVDRIQVAQDRDKWWALENTIMNLWVP